MGFDFVDEVEGDIDFLALFDVIVVHVSEFADAGPAVVSCGQEIFPAVDVFLLALAFIVDGFFALGIG